MVFIQVCLIGAERTLLLGANWQKGWERNIRCLFSKRWGLKAIPRPPAHGHGHSGPCEETQRLRKKKQKRELEQAQSQYQVSPAAWSFWNDGHDLYTSWCDHAYGIWLKGALFPVFQSFVATSLRSFMWIMSQPGLKKHSPGSLAQILRFPWELDHYQEPLLASSYPTFGAVFFLFLFHPAKHSEFHKRSRLLSRRADSVVILMRNLLEIHFEQIGFSVYPTCSYLRWFRFASRWVGSIHGEAGGGISLHPCQGCGGVAVPRSGILCLQEWRGHCPSGWRGRSSLHSGGLVLMRLVGGVMLASVMGHIGSWLREAWWFLFDDIRAGLVLNCTVGPAN